MSKHSQEPNDSKPSPADDHDRPQTSTDKHGGVVIAAICFGVLALLVAFNSC